jgi:two-component system, cell cycle response regulator DivK
MSKRILVMEDQEDLRAIMREFLSASGYTVIEAVEGAEGVSKAASERPDLVLMDIQLPVLDPTQQIKAFPSCATIPIIAVSSFAMKGDEEKARAAGCDNYVTKPYSPIQLLRIIAGVLARSREGGLVCFVGPHSRRHVYEMNFSFGSRADHRTRCPAVESVSAAPPIPDMKETERRAYA